MTAAEYQRARRERLKSDGQIGRLQSEISEDARCSLIYLAKIHRRSLRAQLELLILEAVRDVKH
jgi:hypothetical protein